MNRAIINIEGCAVSLADNYVSYTAKLAIDDDGSDNRWRDPCWQAETSLRLNGKPIDAGSVPYVVVPPAIILGVAPIVLGCLAVVSFRQACLRPGSPTGWKRVRAVVADVGPRKKLGEGSVELARRLGIPESPVSGGDTKHEIHFELYPGVAANIDGVLYQLQRWNGK